MTQKYGATVEEWAQLDLMLGLTGDLLPVVSNPNARISPGSSMRDLGKTPSRYNSQRLAVGFPQWTHYQATGEDIEQWSKESDYGICLQTRLVRAIDVDVTDADQASAIRSFLVDRFTLPSRVRSNSSKFLVAFQLPGDFTKRKFKTAHGIVEFLATGQQFIAVGTHPSGARYEWEGGLPDDFPVLSPEKFEILWTDLATEFAVEAPSEAASSVKAKKLSDVVTSDPVAQHLLDKGLVKRLERDGRLHIVCPWETEHTTESGDTATTYWPAHTGGYANGHFHCLHAHCEHRTDEDFKEAIGYVDQSLVEEFERINESEPGADRIDRGASQSEPTPIRESSDGSSVDHPENRTDTPPKFRFKVESVAEFIQRPPMTWIVKGVLPKAELGVIYGESGSGKTFFVLDLAIAIALGQPWRGKAVRRSRVVYVAAEGAGGLRNRLKAYSHAHQIPLQDLPLGIIASAPNMMERFDALELAKSIKAAGGADIVVLDTMAQVMPGANENSGEDVGKLLAHCKGIHRALGAIVLLVHHSGKDSARGARGWSGLKAAADVEIEVIRSDNARAATVSKIKDGEDGAEFGFTLQSVVVEVDEDGDDISSCVLEHNDDGRPKRHREVKGAIEKAVLTAMEDFKAKGVVEVFEADLVERVKPEVPHNPSVDDQRGKRIRRAIRSLIDACRLRIEGVKLVLVE